MKISVIEKNYLSHLNNDDIERLYERYLNGESKVDLLIEYKVKIKPNKFPRILPPISLKVICWVCKQELYAYRKARSTKYNTCVSCKHKFTLKELKEKTIQRKLLENDKVLEIYVQNLKLDEMFYVYSLVQMKSQLPHLFLMNSEEYAFSVNSLIFPTSELGEEILFELMLKKLIDVDLVSNINMDKFQESYKNNNFKVMDLYWTPQILDNEDKLLSETDLIEVLSVKLKSEIRNIENKEIILNLLTNLFSEELIQLIKLKLREINYDGQIPRLATKKVLNDSLKKLPMSYLRYFIHLNIKNICYSIASNNIPKRIINSIPRSLKDYTSRAITEKWEVKLHNKPQILNDCYAIAVICELFEDVNYEYFSQELSSYLSIKLS